MVSTRQLAARIAADCSATRARAASRALTRAYDAALREVGLQSAQLSLLVAVVLFGEQGAKLSALAARLAMDRTTLTRNLSPLERAGLLRVARSPSDARTRVITLTRAGERKLEEAYPVWQKAQARFAGGFGAERAKALGAELEASVASATTLSDDG
ncbi:MAG TPA: MarR family winged helix-turn-helix transcriptional regulator [Polyangiaceae bacterium]